MKIKQLAISAICLLLTAQAFAWGQKGHDVTAYIAECHLTPEAAQKIDKVLNGRSLVYYANWLDNASHTDDYAYTKTWHYLNVDEGYTLDSMPREEKGDVLSAVTVLYDKLKSGNLQPEAEHICLRMLIHLVGDMHCPMHAGHRSDLGGNRVPVVYFGRTTNLHSVWDSSLVESAHKWGYMEWQQQIDRPNCDVEALQAGTPRDWMLETVALCEGVYQNTPEGANLSYDYVNDYTRLVEQQFLLGGLRLARLLNEIYQ